jgi:hypothetical protein
MVSQPSEKIMSLVWSMNINRYRAIQMGYIPVSCIAYPAC